MIHNLLKARFPFILLFLITALCTLASVAPNSSPDGQRSTTTSKKSRKKGTLIHLLHSDELYFNQQVNREAQILVGNVRFRHDDIILTCDSALFYQQSNSFDAFGHVRMNQGDTLTLVSDVLFYDGTEQLARARHNVVLTHNQTHLYCDSLDYDRLYELGYFFNGGRMVDGENTLESEWGQYSPPTHEAIFNYNVDLKTPESTLLSDTLHYNTESGWARIVGPSNIDNGDNHIYSENGRYDTKGERVYLLNRSIVSNKGVSIEGDSLYYQSDSTLAKAYGRVVYIDRDNHNELRGNYLLYSDSLGYAEASDSAVCIDYSQRDTFYIHADTFKLFTFYIEHDSICEDSIATISQAAVSPSSPALAPSDSLLRLPATTASIAPQTDSLQWSTDTTATASLKTPADSVQVDSVWREIRAYYHVRAYRRDVQAICDSMVFISKDSCMTMYKDPILWQEGQQLLGEEIKAWVNDSTIDSTHVLRQALSVERIDSMCYNQVSGNVMRSYFANGQMDKTIVEGNVLVNYYPFDSDSLMIGLLHAEGTLLHLYMGEKKLDQIKFLGQVDGCLHPLALVTPTVRYLENFHWFDYIRPQDKDDIFNWRPKKDEEKLKTSIRHTRTKTTLPSKGGNTSGKKMQGLRTQ
ncbi:MAG: hypothetical protein K6C30_08150 [Bacteroidaceae bacterium]|nr:hypothetical protein [Bacteroidaceae bacterium]